MNILKCIIIEDQIPAQNTLQEYIRQVPSLQLQGTFISPIEAVSLLDNGEINLVFLDIHLPKINGINFLRALRKPPHIILTTAFSEYAVQGFELDVVDYLLKPYSFERFLKAILKIERIHHEPSIVNDNYLFVKTKQKQIEKINIDNIQCIEAKGDFVLVHTSKHSVIASSTLQNILEKIGNQFCRCHKSYIVNIDAIKKINGNLIQLDQKQIPIGRTFKEVLIKRIKMI